MDHLSVKSGPKRLNFYGQKAVFDHFVRNRHFSSEPFTDIRPIFIDLSVKISRNWLPLRIPARAEAKVDKNRAKFLKFVYRLPKMVRASPKVDQK